MLLFVEVVVEFQFMNKATSYYFLIEFAQCEGDWDWLTIDLWVVLPGFEEGKDDCGFQDEKEVSSALKTIEQLKKLL